MKLEKGRRYRVVKEGARLVGMQPIGRGVRQGWSQKLEIGTILTCNGTSMTSGDGVPIVKWLDAEGHWIADDCQFEPNAPGCSIWTQKPDTSYLEEAA